MVKAVLVLFFVFAGVLVTTRGQETDEPHYIPTQEPYAGDHTNEPEYYSTQEPYHKRYTEEQQEYTEEPTEEPEQQSGYTYEDSTSQCERLNDERSSFSDCCEYPLIVVWAWQHEKCTKTCQNQMNKRCCILGCCLTEVGVLDSTSEPQGLNTGALVMSFMMSVDNNTLWQSTVEASVEYCTNSFADQYWGFECDVVPGIFNRIVECSYLENYRNCPSWNPRGLYNCDQTWQYVQECL